MTGSRIWRLGTAGLHLCLKRAGSDGTTEHVLTAEERVVTPDGAAHQGQVALGSRAREIFIDPGQVFLPLVHISYVPVQSSFVFLTRQVRGMVLGTACQSWPDLHRTSRVGVPLLSTSRPQDHSDWLAMKMR